MKRGRRNLFKKNLFWLVPVLIAVNVPFLFLGGWLVKLLWNWLMPTLFSLPAVAFWQALGLLLLCRILLGGFRFQDRRKGGLIDRVLALSDSVAVDSDETLTPEEKEQFRQRMRERFGPDTFTDETKELRTNEEPS